MKHSNHGELLTWIYKVWIYHPLYREFNGQTKLTLRVYHPQCVPNNDNDVNDINIWCTIQQNSTCNTDPLIKNKSSVIFDWPIRPLSRQCSTIYNPHIHHDKKSHDTSLFFSNDQTFPYHLPSYFLTWKGTNGMAV